jgi:hypothetical protein
MRRVVGLIAIILTIGATGALAWLVLRPPVGVFLAPGAAEIQVTNLRMGEQHISYRCPGPPYAWYWATIRMIEAQRWARRTPLVRPDLAGPRYNPVIPLWFERVSFGFLVEEVMLDPDQGDPNLARIHVYRRIALPFPKSLGF